MPKIIALTGAKGCGKDTVADILTTAYYVPVDRRVRRVAFADPIKNEVMNIFDLSRIDQYDTLKRSHLVMESLGGLSINGRHVVREIGMLMRRYDESQFVRYVDDQIAKDPTAIWVVTDLRFDNELVHLQKLGAKIVKIDRPTANVADAHITERGFDNSVCDIIIENKSTLEQFNRQVLEVFDKKLMEWNWL
jgi:hypothetical protein